MDTFVDYLALSGTTLVGAGLYFILLRPPLLPEDVGNMACRRLNLTPSGAHCVEHAIVSGSAAEQRKKVAELMDVRGRATR